MSKTTAPGKAPHRGKAASPQAMVDDIVRLFELGRWAELETRARSVAARHPTSALGWKALGAALLQQGKPQDAVAPLTRTTIIAPTDAAAQSDLGVALTTLGRHAEAAASLGRAIRLNPRHVTAHSTLAIVLGHLGRFGEALVHHRLSLEITPHRPESHNNLGNLLRDLGRLDEAAACYVQALALRPDYFEAHLNIGLTLADLARFDEAIAAYRRALAIRPDAHVALLSLGSLLSRLGGDDAEIRACLARCVALMPHDADGYVALGNDYLRTKETAQAHRMFRQAQDLRPLIRRPALAAKPAFAALMLDTPGAGCTPMDYLTGNAPYDRLLYCVLPQESPHADLLRASGRVVINMIADADNGADILPFALALVERLGLPTINHPRLVMNSGREAVARRLAGTPLCRVPQTRRAPATTLMDATAAAAALDGLAMPLLVRLAGTHGGDVFEKADDLAAVVAFAARHPDADCYATEYVDYRSADGFFRKYRFIYIDGQLLPYHLAIHDHWMVHHFRTDMANQSWMRAEEEAFLAHAEHVFDDARQSALKSMAAASGLDYCGLDVALGRDGQVVLFETNASMLVHDEKGPTFAYKNPAIARIKTAFDAMVERRAMTA